LLNLGALSIVQASGSALAAASAILNIGGALNFSQGASAYYSVNNFSSDPSYGFQQFAVSSASTFSFNQHLPRTITNTQYLVINPTTSSAIALGYNVPPIVVPAGYVVTGSTVSSSSIGGVGGGISTVNYNLQPQNMYLTAGQSFDVTVSAFYGTGLSLSSAGTHYASATASVAFLVIEESANG
jgi:hypothetical protein